MAAWEVLSGPRPGVPSLFNKCPVFLKGAVEMGRGSGTGRVLTGSPAPAQACAHWGPRSQHSQCCLAAFLLDSPPAGLP